MNRLRWWRDRLWWRSTAQTCFLAGLMSTPVGIVWHGWEMLPHLWLLSSSWLLLGGLCWARHHVLWSREPRTLLPPRPVGNQPATSPRARHRKETLPG